MSNTLIINGAKKFAHSNGQLNDTLTEVADGTLRDLGHDVRIVSRRQRLRCQSGSTKLSLG
ncbi:modulator of drug activity B [Escherichia coli]|nr:modulator of drug activity B [Escherichia coli]